MNSQCEKKLRDAAKVLSRSFMLAQFRENMVNRTASEMMEDRIDPVYLDEITKIDELSSDTVIRGVLDNAEKINYAKKLIRKHRHGFEPVLFQEIMDMLNEIAEDNAWKASKVGRCVISIDDWIGKVQKDIPVEMKNSIVVGRDMTDDNPCNIFIGGYLDNISANEVKEFFLSKEPPVKPYFLLIE